MSRKDIQQACKCLLSLLLLAVFSQLAEAQKRSEKEADGFIGPVKNVYTTTAYVAGESGGPLQEMPALSHSFTYDDKGRLLEDAEILPDGSPDTRRTWKYDSRGTKSSMPISFTTIWFSGRSKLTMRKDGRLEASNMEAVTLFEASKG